MNTIYWHMNATQGGANLHPGVNLPPGANLHPGANCAHEHGFRRGGSISGLPATSNCKRPRYRPSYCTLSFVVLSVAWFHVQASVLSSPYVCAAFGKQLGLVVRN